MDPLLSGDSVNIDRCGKYSSEATSPGATMEELFSMWSVLRSYKQETKSVQKMSAREALKKRLERVKLKNFHC
jgi:hypothetical protein